MADATKAAAETSSVETPAEETPPIQETPPSNTPPVDDPLDEAEAELQAFFNDEDLNDHSDDEDTDDVDPEQVAPNKPKPKPKAKAEESVEPPVETTATPAAETTSAVEPTPTPEDHTQAAVPTTPATPAAEPQSTPAVQPDPAAAPPPSQDPVITPESLRALIGQPPQAPAAPAQVPGAAPQPGAVPVQQPATVPTAPIVSPEQLQQQAQDQWNAMRAQQEQILAEIHYVLDEQTVEQIQIEPEKILPKIMSRVMLDAVQATYGQVLQILPQMMQQVEQSRQVDNQHEDQFFQFWGERGFDLKPHAQDIVALAQAYRNTNPAATLDEFTQNVGAQIIIAKQISPATQATQTDAASGANGNGNGNGTAQPGAGDVPAAPFRSAQSAPGVIPLQPALQGYAELDEALFGEELEE